MFLSLFLALFLLLSEAQPSGGGVGGEDCRSRHAAERVVEVPHVVAALRRLPAPLPHPLPTAGLRVLVRGERRSRPQD